MHNSSSTSKRNRAKLEATPDGTYAVTNNQNNPTENGVIFVLQQTNANTDKQQKTASPIHPYYAVYIRNSGDIRYGCINAKQVLDLFETSAVGKENAIDDLCLWFDQETEYGDNMTQYKQTFGHRHFAYHMVAYEDTEPNFEEG